MKTQIKYLGKHWRKLFRDVVKTSIASFGVIITFADALLNVLPEETTLHNLLYQLVHLPFDKPATILILILILVIVATIANWPTTRAVYKDTNSDTKVLVECCDLFQQQGMRVIHSVDTFDTALGTIISPNSVHGNFLKTCQENSFDIDQAIDNSLKDIAPASEDENLPGRKLRYPLGTVCPVWIDSQQYVLVSFTHLNQGGNINITRKEYTDFLINMWRNLSTPIIRQDTINVAVMGNKFVDLPAEFSTEQKIDLMLQTFFMVQKEKSCCRTLRICVHESNMTEVDFSNYHTIIDHLAKRPII